MAPKKLSTFMAALKPGKGRKSPAQSPAPSSPPSSPPQSPAPYYPNCYSSSPPQSPAPYYPNCYSSSPPQPQQFYQQPYSGDDYQQQYSGDYQQQQQYSGDYQQQYSGDDYQQQYSGDDYQQQYSGDDYQQQPFYPEYSADSQSYSGNYPQSGDNPYQFYQFGQELYATNFEPSTSHARSHSGSSSRSHSGSSSRSSSGRKGGGSGKGRKGGKGGDGEYYLCSVKKCPSRKKEQQFTKEGIKGHFELHIEDAMKKKEYAGENFDTLFACLACKKVYFTEDLYYNHPCDYGDSPLPPPHRISMKSKEQLKDEAKKKMKSKKNQE